MGAEFKVQGTSCCGILELADISRLPGPEAIVKETARLLAERTDFFSSCPAFIMFSGVVGKRKREYGEHYHANRGDDYGQALADYIRAQDLGVINETKPAKNYSGNMLRIWVWAPKWDAMKAIYNAQRSAAPSILEPSPQIQGNTVPSNYDTYVALPGISFSTQYILNDRS